MKRLRAAMLGLVFVLAPWANQWLRAQEEQGEVEQNPDDTTERVLLLLPGAPLLAQLSITIDEQPFRRLREKQLDEIVSQADANGDGQVTWDEASQSRSLAQGRIDGAASPEALTAFKAQYDTNGNDLLDKSELRRLFALFNGGPAFAVQGQAFLGDSADGSQIKELLDTDGDREISAQEIATFPERILRRDANDDGIVTLAELAGPTNFAARLGDARATANVESLLPIDATTDWKRLHAILLERYGRDVQLPVSAFGHTRSLAKKLDANSDYLLSAEELAALRTCEPPLVLDVALGTRTKLRDTVVLATIAPDLNQLLRIDRAADGKLTLDLPGALLELMAPNPKPSFVNAAAQVTTYMANLDRDKNGYLDRRETSAPEIASQFDAWDLDQDGQVYPDELKSSLENQQAPLWQRITVAAMSQGSDLFSKFDVDRDNQLGVREVARSAELLAALDTDGDGAISSRELPVTRFRLAIARGDETYKYLRRGLLLKRPAPAARSTPADAPAWLLNMDTNSDGEVSLREFLGTAEQFKRLDANGDGFIEPSEAL